MFLKDLFRTTENLSESDYQRSEKLLVVDGFCAMGMASLAGGPFLAAFALAIGASNYDVGMLATIALLSQVMQLPGLLLVNNFRKRRAIVTILTFIARSLWIFVVLIPFIFVDKGVTFLLQWVLIASLVGATVGPSWNSLLRDIVPKKNMGRLFARRMGLGTVLALVLTLAGGYFVDQWKVRAPETSVYAYSCLFALGAFMGVLGVFAVSRLPEPTMKKSSNTNILESLIEPVRDSNFRSLMVFIAFWSFAVNMAGPFFIIYMLNRIGVSITMVTTLTVVSQVSNLLFLRIWGRMADRFSSKSVFAVAGPMFLISVLAWSFTTMPERYFFTVPLLFIIHALSGCALSGVNIASASMALKLSPSDKTHIYMTAFGLAAAMAGAFGPFVGGIVADFFASRELALTLSWSDPARQLSVNAINFKALDFVFILAFVTGLFAINKLSKVREEGEVPEGKVVSELMDQVVVPFKMVSSVEGLLSIVARPVNSIVRFKKKSSSKDESSVNNA